jgi:UbiD family decarboxylase
MSSLRDFLAALPEEQILRIKEPLSLDYVPTAIVLELEKRRQTPVLYIEQPAGYDIPVVANLFASRERLARIAGAASPSEFNEAWRRAEEKPYPPAMVAGGPVQEVVQTGSEVDVSSLPISRHFAQDAGQYIGSGILVCKDPDTGVRNLSYQRLQKKGPNRFGASLHSRGHIWEHLLRCEELGRNLEVAVVLGAHPAVHLAAAARVAKEVDEYDLAGGLLGEPVELVRAQTIDVEAPANAEVVLEGEILAGVHEDEGPYGEYTGYATSRSTRNIFVVKAITRRADPIYLDVIPGYSAEHLLLGRAAKEAHVFQRLKEAIPGVRALNYPKSGTHFHAYLSLRKSAEGQARHALLLLLGLDSYIKFAVAVDDDIDVYNESEVLWALATRFQADTDLFVVPKVFCNRLDPSAVDGMSAKMGLDATAPLAWDVERTSLPTLALDEARALLERFKVE